MAGPVSQPGQLIPDKKACRGDGDLAPFTHPQGMRPVAAAEGPSPVGPAMRAPVRGPARDDTDTRQAERTSTEMVEIEDLRRADDGSASKQAGSRPTAQAEAPGSPTHAQFTAARKELQDLTKTVGVWPGPCGKLTQRLITQMMISAAHGLRRGGRPASQHAWR